MLFNVTDSESKLETTCMMGITTHHSETTYHPGSYIHTLRKQSFQHFMEQENCSCKVKGEVCRFCDMWCGTGEMNGMSHPRRQIVICFSPH